LRLKPKKPNWRADIREIVGERAIGEWFEWVEQRIPRDDPLLREVKDGFVALAAITEWNYRAEIRRSVTGRGVAGAKRASPRPSQPAQSRIPEND
jgi:hypothetical protein